MDKKQSFSIKAFNYEQVNPLFTKVDLYVLYKGINRNNSHFTKESIEKALPSIFNTPIVGEYYKESKNFGDHGASLQVNDNDEFEIVVSTKPYGLIPESATFRWEEVTEDDGKVNDYLVVEGAFLWSGRYPEVNTIHDEGYYGQSMEIEVINGKFAIIEGQEVFDIQDFIFSGFCLLGVDKESDPNGHVEPCFEKSRVVAYSLDKESFTNQFEQMMAELKFSLSKKEVEKGGKENMEDVVTSQETEVFADQVETIDELAKQQGSAVAGGGNPQAPVILEEVTTEETGKEAEGEEAPADQASATTEETVVTPEGSAESTDAAFAELETKYSALETDFSAAQNELKELREYKRSRELGDLKEKFTTQLTDQELDTLFTENADMNIEALEVAIFAMIGKKNYSLEPKQKTNKVQVQAPKVSEEFNPYGDIFKK